MVISHSANNVPPPPPPPRPGRPPPAAAAKNFNAKVSTAKVRPRANFR